MFSDLDFLDEILPESTSANNRAMGKFRPKARQKPEKLIPPPSNPSDVLISVSCGDRDSIIQLSSQLSVTEDNVGPTEVLLSETAVSVNIVDLQTKHESSKSEIMFSGFDSLDDIQPTSTNEWMLGNFLPKAQPRMSNPILSLADPSNTSQFVSPAVDPLPTAPKFLVTQESTCHSHSEASVFDGDKDLQKDFRSSRMEEAMVSAGLEPACVDTRSLSSQNGITEEGSIHSSFSAVATCEAAPANASFLLPVIEDHAGSTEASVLEAARCGNDVDLQNYRGQSGAKSVGKFQPKVNAKSKVKKLTVLPSTMPAAADSIDGSTLRPCSSLSIDASSAPLVTQEPAIHVEASQAETEEVAPPSINDILVRSIATRVRVEGKFQPKSISRLKNEKPKTYSFMIRDVMEHIPPVDSHLICPQNEVSEGLQCNSTLVDPSSNLLMTEESVDNTLNSESTLSDSNEDCKIDHGRLEGEEEAEFLCSESLQDTFSQPNPTTGLCVGKFQPKPNAKRKNVKPLGHTVCDDAVGTVSSPWDSPPLKTKSFRDHPLSLESNSLVDSSTIWTCDSSSLLSSSQHPVNQVQMDVAEIPSHQSASPSGNKELQSTCSKSERNNISGGKRKPSARAKGNVGKVQSQNVEELSHGVLNEGPIPETCEDNRAGKSLRQLRKRKAVLSSVHELDDRISENSELENSSNSQMVDDNTDDEYTGEEMPRQKKVTRKPEILASENEKPVWRRKKASEGPDPMTQETSKKKFPHSTRRNRRRLDKILLETPEDDIDRANLRIKDLIMLAEYNERKSIKEEAALKQSIRNQSSASLFPNETHFDEENAFDQGLNRESDEANDQAQPSSTKLNYHTYMTRIHSERWSKSDTELFYQAVRQFGTDFAMIQQLFPNRTRHQVKLKFKNEERKHPLQIADALVHRSKDHSHFELVIQQLQTQAKQNSNRDTTDDPLSESLHATSENEEEESRRADKKEEQDMNDWEGGHSSVKSDEIYYLFDSIRYGTANASFPHDLEEDKYDRF